jgi:hypothetical protein
MQPFGCGVPYYPVSLVKDPVFSGLQRGLSAKVSNEWI